MQGIQYDTLDFQEKIINEYDRKYHLGVTIINGVPLLDIVQKYERQAAEINGYEYTGAGYAYQLSVDLYCQLQEKSSCASDNEPALMICSCLEEGCWPLLVTITETDTSVKWSNFHNHHRSEGKANVWNYSCFPTFEFEKAAYHSALEKLRVIAESQPYIYGRPANKEIIRLRKLYSEIRYSRFLADDDFIPFAPENDMPESSVILVSEPLAGLSPIDIRQLLSKNAKEYTLAKAMAKVHNQTGWIGHNLDALDEPELSETEVVYNEWYNLQDELFQKIMTILYKENESGKAKHDLDVAGNFNKISPFMERNGHRKRAGWWVMV